MRDVNVFYNYSVWNDCNKQLYTVSFINSNCGKGYWKVSFQNTNCLYNLILLSLDCTCLRNILLGLFPQTNCSVAGAVSVELAFYKRNTKRMWMVCHCEHGTVATPSCESDLVALRNLNHLNIFNSNSYIVVSGWQYIVCGITFTGWRIIRHSQGYVIPFENCWDETVRIE